MRSFTYLSILAVLAAVSSWFLWTVQSTLEEDNNQADATPQLYMENFFATRMSSTGVRQYTLASPYLVQLPAEEGTLILSPQIHMFASDGRTQAWQLNSERGRISADNKVINLDDAVTLTRPATDDKLALTMSARDVIVRAQQNIVESSQRVELNSANSKLQGVGFKVYIDTEQVELLSNVRGSHKPSDSS